MNFRPDDSTADRVANLLGLNDAQTLIHAAANGAGRAREVAQQQLDEFDRETKRAMALVVIAQRLDEVRSGMERRGGVMDDLMKEHKAVMSGESKSGCRHLANAMASVDKELAVLKTKAVIYAIIAATAINAVVQVVIKKL